MTHQIADQVYYEGSEYELLGDSSRQLPMFVQYGIRPVGFATGCYKGYFAKYLITNGELYLAFLLVYDADGKYPIIGGISPVLEDRDIARYESLLESVPVTCAIVIGKDRPNNWYYPDIRLPHDYVSVLKIILINGKVNDVIDVSAKAAFIRMELGEIFEERLKHSEINHSESNYRSEDMRRLFDDSYNLAYSLESAT